MILSFAPEEQYVYRRAQGLIPALQRSAMCIADNRYTRRLSILLTNCRKQRSLFPMGCVSPMITQAALSLKPQRTDMFIETPKPHAPKLQRGDM